MDFHSSEYRANAENLDTRPSTYSFGPFPTFLKWAVLTVVVLILLVFSVLWIVNRELPAFIERQLNAHVEGYRFTVGQATLTPHLSLEIRQLTMEGLAEDWVHRHIFPRNSHFLTLKCG